MNTPAQSTVAATLDAIDAATEQRCACGCGTPLDPDGPSGWFASEGCQRRWQLSRPGVLSPEERATLLYACRQFSASMAALWEQIQLAFVPLGRALNDQIERLRPLCAEHARRQPPADPMERALWLRRNRNTGPRPRQRAPRRIDPRGTR